MSKKCTSGQDCLCSCGCVSLAWDGLECPLSGCADLRSTVSCGLSCRAKSCNESRIIAELPSLSVSCIAGGSRARSMCGDWCVRLERPCTHKAIHSRSTPNRTNPPGRSRFMSVINHGSIERKQHMQGHACTAEHLAAESMQCASLPRGTAEHDRRFKHEHANCTHANTIISGGRAHRVHTHRYAA